MTGHRMAIPLTLSLLVSPDVQVWLGNGMGLSGWLFPLCLALVAALHLVTLQAYADIYGGRYQGHSEYGFLRAAFGPWLPLTTSLASRVVFMVCAATVSLVTAGFVFNEVFVYWFANFAFAFLLLALILVIQLAGSSWALRLQFFLVCFVMAMLAILLAAGLAKFSSPPPVRDLYMQGRGLLLAFFMVVGFEFAFLAGDKGSAAQPSWPQVGSVLGGAILVFILWGTVMHHVVEAGRLAHSFNPQMISARQVLGQPGRFVMGAALIAGSAALVNGLLLVLRRQFAELMPLSWTAAPKTGSTKWLRALGVVALAAGPAIMMASGQAGEEGIEIYLRAALVVWLLHYSLVHFAVGRCASSRPWLHLLAGLLLIGAGLALGITEPEPIVFLKSIAMIVLSAGTISLIITQVGDK